MDSYVAYVFGVNPRLAKKKNENVEFCKSSMQTQVGREWSRTKCILHIQTPFTLLVR